MAIWAEILVLDDGEDMQDLFLQRFRHQIKDRIYGFSFAKHPEEALPDSIKKFTDGVPKSDDVTTLCLRHRPRIAGDVT